MSLGKREREKSSRSARPSKQPRVKEEGGAGAEDLKFSFKLTLDPNSTKVTFSQTPKETAEAKEVVATPTPIKKKKESRREPTSTGHHPTGASSRPRPDRGDRKNPSSANPGEEEDREDKDRMTQKEIEELEKRLVLQENVGGAVIVET